MIIEKISLLFFWIDWKKIAIKRKKIGIKYILYETLYLKFVIADKNKIFWDFEKARSYVHKLKIKSETEWRRYYRSGEKPNQIPSDPSNVYKNKGWINWFDWLGKEKTVRREHNWIKLCRYIFTLSYCMLYKILFPFDALYVFHVSHSNISCLLH